MGNLTTMTISLSSTPWAEGRLIINQNDYEIVKETPKTIIVKKGGIEFRHLKEELLKAISDHKNDKLSTMQFKIICYTADIKEAKNILKIALISKVDLLVKENGNAIEALKSIVEL